MAWDQFDSNDIVTDRDLQDYQSLYIGTRRKIREGQQAEATDIIRDLRFEVGVVKMVYITVEF